MAVATRAPKIWNTLRLECVVVNEATTRGFQESEAFSWYDHAKWLDAKTLVHCAEAVAFMYKFVQSRMRGSRVPYVEC